jgi:Spy/CpxP family protein refolding chaperone
MTLATTSPRMLRLLTVGVLAATFVLGAITGGGIYRWVIAARLEFPGGDLRGPWPLRELDLSKEQRTRIDEIFARHRPKLDAVLRETFPAVRIIQENIDSEIRGVLTPEQRIEFDRHKERRPFLPPGLPPPPGGVLPEPPPFPPLPRP